MKRYAQDTSVPVGRSRGEIDALLRRWGAKGVQWTDDFDEGKVALRFAWTHEGSQYMARFNINLPSEDELRKQAIDGRSTNYGQGGRVSEAKLEKLRRARGQAEHRLLLFWLKAAFNAVEAGIISAEALFLPFLEGRDGKTVAEVAVPKLSELLSYNAGRLLPQHGGK